jgi:hypothetical protein
VPCCWPAPAGLPACSDCASCEGSGRSPPGNERFQPRFPAMASGQLRIWWAHPLADLSPQLGVVRRLHQSSLGHLVDRSDRADNIAGSGGCKLLFSCH